MISAVVLAAVDARKTGVQNLSLRLDDKPVLQWVLESALASDVAEVICVTDDLAAARREIKLVDSRLFWHWNPAASRGQSTSVIAGLWASHPQSDGVLFLAGDQLVRKDLINSLIVKFEQSPASIVTAPFAAERHEPILFRRGLFPELLKLTGDIGASSLLEKHAKETALVDWQDENPYVNSARQRASERLKERI